MNEFDLLRRIEALESQLAIVQRALDMPSPYEVMPAPRFDPNDPSTPDAEVMRLVRAGKKIQAIKVQRELTGVGLAEAKAYVERLG